MLTKFSQNPYECNLSIIFDDLIRLNATDKWHKIVNKVRILPQNVLQHLDSLRGHVGDLEAEEVLKLRADSLG